jgi:ABC-type transport system substrate-binding protein
VTVVPSAKASSTGRWQSVAAPGVATAAPGGVVPPGMPGHVAGLQPIHDPREAARLLHEAGATLAAGGRPLTIEVPARAVPLAEALARGRGDVGVACEIAVADGDGTPSAEADPEGWDVGAGGWVADYADPDNFLRVFVGLNLPDPAEGYHALLRKAALTRDQQERLALYREAEVRLADGGAMVPLVYRATSLLLKPWVKRFVTPAVKHVGCWKDVTVDRPVP